MKALFFLFLSIYCFFNSVYAHQHIKGEVYGIDVSHFQGEIDWQKVAKTEVKFVFIKSTYGENSVDPEFTENWKSSIGIGLLRGTYHYFDPKLDALKQAKHFIGKTQRDFGDFPPIVDIEAFEKQKNLDVIKDLKIFLDEVEESTKCKPIIYTSNGFWNQLDTHEFGKYSLWLADYTEKPSIPKGWSEWLFWQFTDQGKVDGINGNVDTSRFSLPLEKLDDYRCQ